MFLIKIFHFLKGYVILSVSGHNNEEFLDAALKRGITPIRISDSGSDMLLWLTLSDFFALKSVTPTVRVHIEKKCGAVFLLKRLKKRKVFAAGMAVFLLMLAAGSQFIWEISYEGTESCDMEQLESAVRLAGIYEGMPKCRLKSGYEMKNIILNNTDNICWAWVYIKGTRAVVTVREDVIAPQVFEPDTPCDIIAMRSGIIKRVTATHGRAVVCENQAVAPGDTIISGTYAFENEPGYQVHAAGVAEAYTEHTRSGVYKQLYCYKKYTGKKRRFATLRFFKWELPLYINGRVKLDEYDSTHAEHDLKIREHYTGIGISIDTMCEYVVEKEPISYDTAVEMAKNELEKQIAGELLRGAQLTDSRVDAEKIDEGTVRVTVTMSFIEEIGTEKRIEEVNFIEPKTD